MNMRHWLCARATVRAAGARSSICLMFVCLLVLVCHATVLAETAPAVGDELCMECHSLDARTWEQSAHAAPMAQTGAPAAHCTDCHGEYSDDHPDDGLMALDVSSATCATCHTDTYAQWQTTIHASNDVQCIGCHQAHSQDLRLTEQALCASCHTTPNDDAFHKAHWLAETACIDCHMAGTAPKAEMAAVLDLPAATDGVNVAIAQQSLLAPLGPDHDFVTVSSGRCLDCHRDDVQSTVSGHAALETRLLESQQSNSRLATELGTTRRNLGVVQGFTPVALGMGLGLGGMLGIIFMLAFARTDAIRTDSQRPEDAARQTEHTQDPTEGDMS